MTLGWPSEIELRWQDRWEREGTFHAANPAGVLSGGALSAGFGAESGRPKFYLLDFFPYPSGIGLHVGHAGPGDGPRRYRRELNVMPQWAGSCWYYLRYLDPGHETALADPQIERYWTSPSGVDLYVGGVEHAVLGGHRAAAAPDHRRRAGGLRRAAVPHRDRADHRADRARVPAAARGACRAP